VFDTLILSAGLGTRLLPLTRSTPKPLLHISESQTILSRLISQFSENEGDIYININHLAQCFLDTSKVGSMNCIRFIYEKERLGSHNTLKLVSGFSPRSLLVVHGDLVLSKNEAIKLVHSIHKNPDQSLMVVHERLQSEARSIVSLDSEGTIVNFREVEVSSHLSEPCYSNSGIYYFSKTDLESLALEFRRPLGMDLSAYVIRQLISMRLLRSHSWNADRVSIDSLEALDRASRMLIDGCFK